TIKISTNTALYEKMPDDIDFNCGDILEGTSSIDSATNLFNLIVETANGKKTKSELAKVGWEEFVPWNSSETL
ncbi:MAG: UxaA family hydrolase, partial [Bdellovibrionales bacterium]|nr:UxaA family hydrolase [Bdellovibrionales bacterium]